MTTICSTSALGQYLSSNSASPFTAFHPDLEFRFDPVFGLSVFSTAPLPAGSTIVSCPLDLAITPTSSKRCLSSFIPSSETLSDHESLCLYLSLHLLPPSSLPPSAKLEHHAYVESLPKKEAFLTPLHFGDEELELLEGTNLVGAVKERREKWMGEWRELMDKLKKDGVEVEGVTWEIYLWACTVLSSRAFPSSLLTSSAQDPDPTPILFPGVDTLNHSPRQPISWVTDVSFPLPSTSSGVPGSLSLQNPQPIPQGVQVFNNYGAKPNEELLLGYGFVLEDNEADVVALKLSLPPTPSLPTILSKLGLKELRHFVPRSGVLPPELLAQMRLFLAVEEEMKGVEEKVEGGEGWEEVLKWISWENEMDVLDALEGMLEVKLAGLKRPLRDIEGTSIRYEVWEMVAEYKDGQIAVLEAALEFRSKLLEETVAKAEADGFVMDEEGDDEDEEDA